MTVEEFAKHFLESEMIAEDDDLSNSDKWEILCRFFFFPDQEDEESEDDDNVDYVALLLDGYDYKEAYENATGQELEMMTLLAEVQSDFVDACLAARLGDPEETEKLADELTCWFLRLVDKANAEREGIPLVHTWYH